MVTCVHKNIVVDLGWLHLARFVLKHLLRFRPCQSNFQVSVFNHSATIARAAFIIMCVYPEDIKHQEDLERNESCTSAEQINKTMKSKSRLSNSDAPHKLFPKSIDNQQKIVKRQETGKFEYCTTCDNSLDATQVCWKHNMTDQEGIIYHCDDCDYTAADQVDIKAHQQSNHEDEIYSCDLCDYEGNGKTHLSAHKNSKHEGLIYSCTHCDFETTQQQNFRAHKQSIHKSVIVFCLYGLRQNLMFQGK